MSLKIALAASALIAVASPGWGQEAPAAPAPAEQAAPALTEAEIEARGEAFEASMEAMGQELEAVIANAEGDVAKARADSDPIVAKYQVEADAFATALTGFLTGMAATLPEGEQRTQMTAMAPMVEGQIKSAPAQLRDQAIASMTTPAAEPAAPAAPATPQ